MTSPGEGTLRFDDRVIVVTGAGRGMGASHAAELARRGARVIVNDLGGPATGGGGDAGPATAVVEGIRAAGGVAEANWDSVATAAGCEAIVAAALDAYGRLDGIVHNAGIHEGLLIPDLDEGRFDEILRVHLHGAFNLTRAGWPHLAERQGRIVYISSGSGLYGAPAMAAYASAKTALVGLARAAAAEGAMAGIAVNALAVAAHTRMFAETMEPIAPNAAAWFQVYMKPELPTAPLVWLMHEDSGVTGRTFQAFGPHVAEIFTGETRGFTKLDLTPEDVRDHAGQILDRTDHIEVRGVLEYHHRMVDFVVEAGAEPPLPDELLQG